MLVHWFVAESLPALMVVCLVPRYSSQFVPQAREALMYAFPPGTARDEMVKELLAQPVVYGLVLK